MPQQFLTSGTLPRSQQCSALPALFASQTNLLLFLLKTSARRTTNCQNSHVDSLRHSSSTSSLFSSRYFSTICSRNLDGSFFNSAVLTPVFSGARFRAQQLATIPNFDTSTELNSCPRCAR